VQASARYQQEASRMVTLRKWDNLFLVTPLAKEQLAKKK
jgi:hypothetical protein